MSWDILEMSATLHKREWMSLTTSATWVSVLKPSASYIRILFINLELKVGYSLREPDRLCTCSDEILSHIRLRVLTVRIPDMPAPTHMTRRGLFPSTGRSSTTACLLVTMFEEKKEMVSSLVA